MLSYKARGLTEGFAKFEKDERMRRNLLIECCVP